MPTLNVKNAIILAVIILVTLKFRDELLSLIVKVPVVGSFVA